MNLLVQTTTTDDGSFHGPSIDEFFPPAVFSIGSFEVNRIMLVRFVAVLAILLVFWLGTRRMKLIPGRGQSIVEMGLDFVRVNIAEDLLGKKDGTRFLPILTSIFFMVLFMNLTGIDPVPEHRRHLRHRCAARAGDRRLHLLHLRRHQEEPGQLLPQLRSSRPACRGSSTSS